MVESLAGRIGAIVARGTVVHDSGVIEDRRRKCPAWNVTDTAILARYNVTGLGILAGCINTVVAGITPAVDHFRARVVDKRISKARGVVANGAVAGRVLMYWRIGLAPGAERYICGAAVMTRGAVLGYIQVTKNRWDERRCRVAVRTVLVCRQMVCYLGKVWIGREKLTRMTTLTTAHNAWVRCLQEGRRCETNR